MKVFQRMWVWIKKKSHTFLISGLLFSMAFAFIGLESFIAYKTNNPQISVPTGDFCKKDGLVSYWKFDEIRDNSVIDCSENGNHGILQTHINSKMHFIYGYPELTAGKIGNALQFKGKQWVSAGNKKCFITDKFTISVWIWQEKDEDVLVPTIIAKSAWPRYDGWWLCTTTKGAAGQMQDRDLDLAVASGCDFQHIKSGYQLPLREWHHVAVSMDNNAHKVRFYIDGKPYGPEHTHVLTWNMNWNHDLFIGGYDGSGRWPWYGKLDEIRFYNKVLSADEIKKIYADSYE